MSITEPRDIDYSDHLTDAEFLNNLTAAIVSDPVTLMVGFQPDMLKKKGLRPTFDQSRVFIYGAKQAEVNKITNNDLRFKTLGFLKTLNLPIPPASLILNTSKLSVLEAALVRSTLSKAEVGTVVIVVDDDLHTAITIMESRKKIELRHILSNGSLYAALGVVKAPESKEERPW